MMSVATSVFPLAGGVPATQVAPSVEEKWVLQPSLTLLVFILIPCVVLLFFLNCFLLFHRLPSLSPKQRSKRRGGPRGNNPCARATHFRLPPGCLGASNKSLCDGRCASISQGLEATLALGESAHVSLGTQSREWCHKLEETPGLHYSPRPSRMAIVPFSSSRSCGMPHEGDISWNEVEDDRGGTRSSSEQETRYNAAPPNTPAAAMAPGTVTPKGKFCCKTSTHRKRLNGVASLTPLGSVLFDNASSIPPEDTPSYLYHNSSSTGPGLDSDFGVSAGVSLHILSSDSDSGSHSWASGMEWDYYDPCYMRKNRLRNENRQLHNLPVICSKQYWV
ncbi:protein huluwa-like isoform X2 [Rana temporaria]|uniref:protein huluwa-like isoform X2 n=1 Tax=Rana temporaria TaxID=8407 RepID=UPI001AAD650D|nr:protein huluwa-like isoform X2 [Rana temporaria]